MRRLLIGFYIIPLSICFAQEQKIVSRLSKPLVFDGKIDDSEWIGIEPFPVTMHKPIYNGIPSEKTEIYLEYDDKYIY